MNARKLLSATGIAILLGVGTSACAGQVAQDSGTADPGTTTSSQPSRASTPPEPTTPSSSPERTTQSERPTREPESPQDSASVRQARGVAQDYLDYTSFSRSGLIDQLEFEGFSTQDATVAVDGLDVDWREQAVQKAFDYLDYSSFSLSGLIDQLEFEGFTPEQAAYGAEAAYGGSGGGESGGGGSASAQQAVAKAQDYLDFSSFSRSGLIDQLEFEGFSTQDATAAVDSLNIDWNQQAALKAQEYLDFSSFSRSGLIDQLVFEGFTQSQAQYGVSQVGL